MLPLQPAVHVLWECAGCGGQACFRCLERCWSCLTLHCTRCYVTDYSGRYEQAVCLTCLGPKASTASPQAAGLGAGASQAAKPIGNAAGAKAEGVKGSVASRSSSSSKGKKAAEAAGKAEAKAGDGDGGTARASAAKGSSSAEKRKGKGKSAGKGSETPIEGNPGRGSSTGKRGSSDDKGSSSEEGKGKRDGTRPSSGSSSAEGGHKGTEAAAGLRGEVSESTSAAAAPGADAAAAAGGADAPAAGGAGGATGGAGGARGVPEGAPAGMSSLGLGVAQAPSRSVPRVATQQTVQDKLLWLVKQDPKKLDSLFNNMPPFNDQDWAQLHLKEPMAYYHAQHFVDELEGLVKEARRSYTGPRGAGGSEWDYDYGDEFEDEWRTGWDGDRAVLAWVPWRELQEHCSNVKDTGNKAYARKLYQVAARIYMWATSPLLVKLRQAGCELVQARKKSKQTHGAVPEWYLPEPLRDPAPVGAALTLLSVLLCNMAKCREMDAEYSDVVTLCTLSIGLHHESRGYEKAYQWRCDAYKKLGQPGKAKEDEKILARLRENKAGVPCLAPEAGAGLVNGEGGESEGAGKEGQQPRETREGSSKQAEAKPQQQKQQHHHPQPQHHQQQQQQHQQHQQQGKGKAKKKSKAKKKEPKMAQPKWPTFEENAEEGAEGDEDQEPSAAPTQARSAEAPEAAAAAAAAAAVGASGGAEEGSDGEWEQVGKGKGKGKRNPWLAEGHSRAAASSSSSSSKGGGQGVSIAPGAGWAGEDDPEAQRRMDVLNSILGGSGGAYVGPEAGESTRQKKERERKERVDRERQETERQERERQENEERERREREEREKERRVQELQMLVEMMEARGGQGGQGGQGEEGASEPGPNQQPKHKGKQKKQPQPQHQPQPQSQAQDQHRARLQQQQQQQQQGQGQNWQQDFLSAGPATILSSLHGAVPARPQAVAPQPWGHGPRGHPGLPPLQGMFLPDGVPHTREHLGPPPPGPHLAGLPGHMATRGPQGLRFPGEGLPWQGAPRPQVPRAPGWDFGVAGQPGMGRPHYMPPPVQAHFPDARMMHPAPMLHPGAAPFVPGIPPQAAPLPGWQPQHPTPPPHFPEPSGHLLGPQGGFPRWPAPQPALGRAGPGPTDALEWQVRAEPVRPFARPQAPAAQPAAAAAWGHTMGAPAARSVPAAAAAPPPPPAGAPQQLFPHLFPPGMGIGTSPGLHATAAAKAAAPPTESVHAQGVPEANDAPLAMLLEEMEREKECCCVCLDREPNTMIKPCGHEITCYECLISIMEQDGYGKALCPMCRALISDIVALQ